MAALPTLHDWSQGEIIEILMVPGLRLVMVDWPAEAADITAPEVSLVSPAEGTIASDDAITVRVTDDEGIGLITISAGTESIFNGSGFASGYADGSTRTDTLDAEDVIVESVFVVRRAPRWGAGDVEIDVTAVDTSGNAATESFTFSVPGSAIPGVALISPAEGSIENDDAITVRVTDDEGIGLVTITAGAEVVYDGAGFAAAYAVSSRTDTLDGEETVQSDFVIRRSPRWAAGDLEVIARAVDTSGNLASATFDFSVTAADPRPAVDLAELLEDTALGLQRNDGSAAPAGGWNLWTGPLPHGDGNRCAQRAVGLITVGGGEPSAFIGGGRTARRSARVQVTVRSPSEDFQNGETLAVNVLEALNLVTHASYIWIRAASSWPNYLPPMSPNGAHHWTFEVLLDWTE